MNKKLIPKYQTGKKILNWLGNQFIKFGNAQINGTSGADSYMATMSGYKYDPKIKQYHQQYDNSKNPVNDVYEKIDKEVKRKIYNYVDPTQAYPRNLPQAIRLGVNSLLHGDTKQYEVEDSVSDAAWRKRLGLRYDSKFLPENGDGSVRLPKHIEAEIPIDTNMVKQRIADNENLLEYYNTKRPEVITNKNIIGKVLKLDKQTLDSLRHTYKTGEPVVINENAHNNRQLIKDGYLELGLTPLNVLGNFTIRWNPETQQMEYFDRYDFNQFEWGVPGKPFEIKGTITPKSALKSKKK